jgi:acetyltransferase-like isoleucine patch superfamily enzyme
VPANTIAAGVPARVIRRRGDTQLKNVNSHVVGA